MSIPTYRQEQEEFLESIMDVLTLSGYNPKMKEDYPAIQIKLIARREQNLPGGFVMMSTAEVMASRRSAYAFAF